MPKLSAIIPLRDRSGLRLENCLRSLRWQDLAAEDLEIVLADFGSSAEHLASVRALAATYDAVVEREDTDDLWNRARALNLGIQAATGELAFCTDADMIFAPDFVRRLIETHATQPEGALVLCKCHDLPEDAPQRRFDAADFAALRALATVRDTSGTGACQVATRDFFYAVRGYDEAFKYWGAEDNDMVSRASRYGLQRVWLGDETAMLHQWHETMKNDRPVRRKLNSWRYKLTRRIVVKNKARWGKIVG